MMNNKQRARCEALIYHAAPEVFTEPSLVKQVRYLGQDDPCFVGLQEKLKLSIVKQQAAVALLEDTLTFLETEVEAATPIELPGEEKVIKRKLGKKKASKKLA
jgi:hypothetical protein